MKKYSQILGFVILTIFCSCGERESTPVTAPPPSPTISSTSSTSLFDDNKVHTIKVNFENKDFWDSLVDYKNLKDSLLISNYMLCNVEIDGEKLDSSGISIKGESSYDFYPTKKKSFKIGFNKFIKGKKYQNFKKISLNNNFKDPAMMREKIMLDFIRRQGLPAPRSSYARLYLNDVYWGLYLVVEEIDSKFLATNFSNDSIGNLYKGEPQAELTWHGDNVENYSRRYKKETNEKENNWKDLIGFIRTINDNSDEETYRKNLEKIFNIDNCLKIWAINNLFVNVDAYNMLYPHNYFLYHNTATDKFEWISYDFNYGFAAWNSQYDLNSVENFDILFVKQPMELNPFTEKLLINNKFFRKKYLDIMNKLVNDQFTEQYLFSRMDEISALISKDVYADSQKMYSNEDFDNNILEALGDIDDPGAYTPGLKSFVVQRRESVLSQLAKINK